MGGIVVTSEVQVKAAEVVANVSNTVGNATK